MNSIFDLGDQRYIAQVVPESFPGEKQPVLKNWSDEDREMFCGGNYAKYDGFKPRYVMEGSA